MKSAYARREFLRKATRGLAFLGVGSSLYNGTLLKFAQKAYAATVGGGMNPGGYYVHMSFPGGPPRWYFDLPLTPHGLTATNFVAGGFGTVLEKSGSTFNAVYKPMKFTAAGKTLWLPPVWSMGADRPFTELLPHTAFIRGMDMEINSHALNNSRQVAPIVGGYSINGAVADASRRPVPSVNDPNGSNGTAFRSRKGMASATITYREAATENPCSILLQPFKNFMTGRPVHDASKSALQEQAFQEFEKYAEDRGFSSSALTAMYDNAIDLMDQNVYALSDQWAPTVEKYRRLVTQALRPAKGQLPGIYDVAVAPSASRKFNLGDDLPVTVGDVRDMIGPDTDAINMAANFAIAEILLDKITSNINLSFRGLERLQTGKVMSGLGHDQHNTGDVISTMYTTLFYRSFLSCLTEFVNVLKTRDGIFQRTVIHISAEFNRTPQGSGYGSDHGFRGSNTTLISGMINKPSVIGNIQKNDYTTTYRGTFGIAKPYVLEGFNRPIQVNDVARTVTSMLAVEDIVTNGRVLLAPVNGFWQPKKEEAENV